MAATGGTALVLVEQHAAVALSLTREAVVLERGRIAHRATSAELLAHGEDLDRLIGLKVAP